VTSPAAPIRRHGPAKLLAALGVVALIVALLTPESPQSSEGGGRSTYSTAPGGARMLYELAQRMGWQPERRTTTLDSGGATGPTRVHVVLAPSSALGAREVHRLLDDVRRGGALVFALDGADEIADSLGVAQGRPGRFLSGYGDPECPTPQSFSERAVLAVPPEVRQLVWLRPPPGRVVTLASTHDRIDAGFPVAVGFPLGAGRVAVASTSLIFANDVIRQCSWGADVAAARVLEYVRPSGDTRPRLVFDEFHHGYGTHGGSLSAVATYLSRTPSGHFVAQALLAGLLLVLALAPRPIVPRETGRIQRRSPLEHAEALGHAYADVGATRTATARLVSGVRRRVGRVVGAGVGADDETFLSAAAERFPTLAEPVSSVREALRQPVSPRAFVDVGEALKTIEHHLTTPPTHRS